MPLLEPALPHDSAPVVKWGKLYGAAAALAISEGAAQAKRLASSRYTTESKELPASFPPMVEVYNELSLKRIIVEVQAHDQIGLLYRLVKAISDHGFDTTFARINTERSVAIDTFYIESNKPDDPVEASRLHALRDALRAVITPEPVAATLV